MSTAESTRGSRRPPAKTIAKVTAACGHAYRLQQIVPFDSLTMEQYQEWRRELLEDASFAPCPRCSAENEVERIRTSTAAIAEWLLADPPVPLENEDPIALAKAEGARYLVLQNLLALTSSGVQNIMRPATAGVIPRLLLQGVRAMFPEETWHSRENAQDITDLNATLLQGSKNAAEAGYALDYSIFPSSSTYPNGFLAVWLRLRDVWIRWTRLPSQSNEEYWYLIADDIEAVAYFHASSDSLGISNASRIFAAMVACEIADWENAEAAWEFYQRLGNPKVGAVFASADWHQQSARIQDALATASVVAALEN